MILHCMDRYQSVLKAPFGGSPAPVRHDDPEPPLFLSEQPKSLLPRSSFRFSLHVGSPLLLPPSAPTSEGDDEHGKKEQHEGDAKTPHSGSEVGMAARLIVIDVVTQDSERAEIGSHHDQTQYPGDKGGEDCKKRPEHAGANGNDPGYERYAAGNGMQDHCSGQGIGSSGFDVRELGAVGRGDDVRGCVANVAARAPVRRVSGVMSVRHFP